jgi:hypothetical protein
VAPSSGPVSCQFVGSASGGTGSYSYDWTFAGPSGSAPALGATVSPDLGCGLQTGAVSFDVSVTLKITSGTASFTVGPTKQLITRLKGACNT